MATRTTTDPVRGMTIQESPISPAESDATDPASRRTFGEEMPTEGAR